MPLINKKIKIYKKYYVRFWLQYPTSLAWDYENKEFINYACYDKRKPTELEMIYTSCTASSEEDAISIATNQIYEFLGLHLQEIIDTDEDSDFYMQKVSSASANTDLLQLTGFFRNCKYDNGFWLEEAQNTRYMTNLQYFKQKNVLILRF